MTISCHPFEVNDDRFTASGITQSGSSIETLDITSFQVLDNDTLSGSSVQIADITDVQLYNYSLS